jgi:hypothetical protein
MAGECLQPSSASWANRDIWNWQMIDMLEATAYHEAGHAVALLHRSIPFRYVTLRSRLPDVRARVAGRHRSMRCRPDDASLISAAGPIAHARFLGLGAEYLFKHADGLGWTNDLRDFANAEDIRGTTESMAQSWFEHEQTMASLWPQTKALARELLASPRALTHAEVRAIVGAL